MVAERPFGQDFLRVDGAAEAKVGLGVNRQLTAREIIGIRWPASAPANVSSLSPSGRGITAASIMAGVPPTNTFTRNGSPRRMAAA